MTAELIIPLIAIVAVAFAVYRVFAFLRVDTMCQVAPSHVSQENADGPAPAYATSSH